MYSQLVILFNLDSGEIIFLICWLNIVMEISGCHCTWDSAPESFLAFAKTFVFEKNVYFSFKHQPCTVNLVNILNYLVCLEALEMLCVVDMGKFKAVSS